MRILRFIAILFCCVSFASASFASVQMQCCLERSISPSMTGEATPCHDMGEQDSSKQDSAMKMQGCNCACTLQTVHFPAPKLPERIAQVAALIAAVPLLPLEFHPSIDAPPKAFS